MENLENLPTEPAQPTEAEQQTNENTPPQIQATAENDNDSLDAQAEQLLNAAENTPPQIQATAANDNDSLDAQAEQLLNAAENIITPPAVTVLPAANKEKQTTKQKNTEPPKPANRITKSMVLYNTEDNPEFEHVNNIVNARIASGITVDFSHFIRQCVDFAINSHHNQGAKFAVPQKPPFYLKNAFYKPNK